MARKRNDDLVAISARVQAGFGSRLQQARNEKNLSQKQLAEALRITRTSVSNIERGRHRVFLDQVYLAARFIGVNVQDLLPPRDEIFVSPAEPSLAEGVPDSVVEELSSVAKAVSAEFSRPDRSSSRSTRR